MADKVATGAPDPNDPGEGAGRKPLSPATRKRLAQLFTHASKQAASDNFDYATKLFVDCVLGDKNNSVYWQSFFGNLRKKFDNNKKGAKLASIRTSTDRATLKKCQMRKDWDGVFKHGVEILKLNPWDVSTLLSMAAAGEQLELDEVPLIFLKGALDASPKDPEVNTAAGNALRARGQLDQALACWQRVLEARPDSDEAKHAIGDLTVEKTIQHGGYEGAQSSRDVKVDKTVSASAPQAGTHDLSPEQKLEKAIRSNPTDAAAYLELAERFCDKDDFGRAIKILKQAQEVCEDDAEVRGKIEDAQIRGLRKKLHDLEAEYKKTKSDDIKQQWKETRKQIDIFSLQRTKHLVERYPNNLAYVYDLAIALQQVGKPKEAIEQFQKVRSDPRRRGEGLLRLGQCFYQIKQPRLAASNFEAALEEIGENDPELRKDSLYWAGKMAFEQKDLDKAERLLTDLAGIDFGYKDVAALLDKINELRDTE